MVAKATNTHQRTAQDEREGILAERVAALRKALTTINLGLGYAWMQDDPHVQAAKNIAWRTLGADSARQQKTNRPVEELNTKQLAASYGVGIRAVDGWVARGLSFVKQRGRRFFDRRDVRKWLAEQGLLPGARGVPGGRARARQRRGGTGVAQGQNSE